MKEFIFLTAAVVLAFSLALTCRNYIYTGMSGEPFGKCPHCGAPASAWEVRDESLHCFRCGGMVKK